MKLKAGSKYEMALAGYPIMRVISFNPTSNMYEVDLLCDGVFATDSLNGVYLSGSFLDGVVIREIETLENVSYVDISSL